jgi:hypothetical protein
MPSSFPTSTRRVIRARSSWLGCGAPASPSRPPRRAAATAGLASVRRGGHVCGAPLAPSARCCTDSDRVAGWWRLPEHRRLCRPPSPAHGPGDAATSLPLRRRSPHAPTPSAPTGPPTPLAPLMAPGTGARLALAAPRSAEARAEGHRGRAEGPRSGVVPDAPFLPHASAVEPRSPSQTP